MDELVNVGIVVFLVLLVGGVVFYAIFSNDATETEDKMSSETVWVRLAHPPTGRGLFRFVDYEASVVCWLFQVDSGLFCLPLSETTLRR